MIASKWYMVPEVARLIRIRESTVLADVRAGRLAAINVSNTARPRYRISQEALDAYLQAKAVVPAIKPARRQRSEVPQYV